MREWFANDRAWFWPAVLVTSGSVTVLLANFLLTGSAQVWGIIAGVAVSQSCLIVLWRGHHRQSGESAGADTDRSGPEELYATQAKLLQEQAERIREQQRSLASRLARVHEFLEYPIPDDDFNPSAQSAIRLSEQDRQVHTFLEAEAARVYEGIRSNKYMNGGTVNIELVRHEVFTAVQKIAQIYSPASRNPLLETSFEQLARAMSRICLHALVLLEQLPIDVKRYNINELYKYFRRAIQGYGTYQQVAPWLKHLTRGAYIGRMAAGTNPVALGAWWLATEAGRRGTQKLVENFVDRQAVTALNDIVTIIGVETANVYGPGFRQRDPAWVYGAELSEMLHRFPVSRESLREALREITNLPLRNEYDRIYLYRCVANHRSSGQRLADPAALTREEREVVARRLEAFFAGVMHGITTDDRAAWCHDVETRLDLKLKLSGAQFHDVPSTQASDAIRALYAFLTTVASMPPDASIRVIEATNLLTHLPHSERTALLNSLPTATAGLRFEPPDLDPASQIADEFIHGLFEGAAQNRNIDAHVEQLVIEVATYFRRSRDEAMGLLDDSFRRRIQQRAASGVSLSKISADTIRLIHADLDSDELLLGVFSGITAERSQSSHVISDSILAVMGNREATPRRMALFDSEERLWTGDSSQRAERRRGYLIDDCVITGGQWHSTVIDAADRLVIPGSLTGGGYSRAFGVIQELCRSTS